MQPPAIRANRNISFCKAGLASSRPVLYIAASSLLRIGYRTFACGGGRHEGGFLEFEVAAKGQSNPFFYKSHHALARDQTGFKPASCQQAALETKPASYLVTLKNLSRDDNNLAICAVRLHHLVCLYDVVDVKDPYRWGLQCAISYLINKALQGHGHEVSYFA
jgi:hypothetical protein